MKKYVLCPGHVTSKTDGDVHYIDAFTLAYLYKVLPHECYVDTSNSNWKRGQPQEHLDSLIWLFPDPTGRYELPRK